MVMNALGGVCSENYRGGVAPTTAPQPHSPRDSVSDWSFLTPRWPCTKALILNRRWNFEILQVDKSLQQNCFKCTDFWGTLTSGFTLQCVCFAWPISVISIVGESNMDFLNKLCGAWFWAIPSQETHMMSPPPSKFYYASNWLQFSWICSFSKEYLCRCTQCVLLEGQRKATVQDLCVCDKPK